MCRIIFEDDKRLINGNIEAVSKMYLTLHVNFS